MSLNTNFDPADNLEQNEQNESGKVVISTKAPKAILAGVKPEGWSIDLPFNFGADINEAAAMYGADHVYNFYAGQVRVAFQSQVRRLAEAGKSDEEIVTALASWRPGSTIALDKDPLNQTRENFMKLSPEQQAELVAGWQANLGSLGK